MGIWRGASAELEGWAGRMRLNVMARAPGKRVGDGVLSSDDDRGGA